jgi:hypothetical protein
VYEEPVREKTIPALLAAILLTPLACTSTFAQTTANLFGIIKDAQHGDTLPGANVALVGTGMVATSDISGKYFVR